MISKGFTILGILLAVIYLVSAKYVIKTFQDRSKDKGGVFNHLVRNKNTGELYLSAENRLYKLSPTLLAEQTVQTGPLPDNPECPPFPNQVDQPCPGSHVRRDMPNFNKVLLIDYNQNKLIACSTLYHGFCEKRHLNDLNQRDLVSYTPVVANNKTATTYAFIARGPPDKQGFRENVLYVGATWTTTGGYFFREAVKAFSVRNLDDFDFVYKDLISGQSFVDIDSLQRDTFPVYYKYGFSSENFSYMVTVQKAGPSLTNYISRLIRVCQNDKKLNSYAEMDLKCTHNGQHYNILQAAYLGRAGTDLAQSMQIPTSEDVLFGVFSAGKTSSSEPLPNSALCVYPMREVRRIFTENIQDCFKGIGNTGPEHIQSPYNCFKTAIKISDDYCGDDVNHPISGTKPIETVAAMHFPNVTASSLIVTTTHDYTVAFMGQKNGHLTKIAIDSRSLASKYEDLLIESNKKIYPDMQFDIEKKHLYALTEDQVFMIEVQQCYQYKTCASCLGAKDPYCGWCSLENRCSQRFECSEHDTPLRWLPYSGQQCTTISNVVPSEVQKVHNKVTTLTLQIQNLPSYSGEYLCAFSGYGIKPIETQAARTTSGGVRCDTPSSHMLPMIPTGQDHIVMKLSVQMNGQDFVSTNFTFFDCDLHDSCSSCTMSDYQCMWCIKSHSCTHDSENCGKDDDIIIGNKDIRPSDSRGPSYCPQIKSDMTKILVPSGTRKKVSVKYKSLRDYQTDLKCFFRHNQGLTAPAIKLSDRVIECGYVEFSYVGDTKYRNVPFFINWGGNKPLDNPENIQVQMYKCNAMASTCGECLTQDRKYNCGWCESTESCSIQRQCPLADSWLPYSSVCRDPRITSFYPEKGPLAGGTNLTILGQNLGKEFREIRNGIFVVGVKCEPYEELYRPPSQIVCKIGSSPNPVSGDINISVLDKYVAVSDKPFQYKQPTVHSIYPVRGPQSGGTRIIIHGEHLDAGTGLQAFIGNLSCTNITRLSPKNISCYTSNASSLFTSYVTFHMDDDVIKAYNVMFEYVEDPTIEGVDPSKVIRGGGIKISVYGKGFSVIQKPKMILWYGDQPYESNCTAPVDDKMYCSAPNVSSVIPQKEDPVSMSFGFILDNVEHTKNLTEYSEKFNSFFVYPNPEFDGFDNTKNENRLFTKSHQQKNEYLTINGKYLNPPIKVSDVTVWIGLGICNVTSVATTQLTCIPPKKQPKSREGGPYPEVIVRVGFLDYRIGFLKYEEPEVLSLPAIIGIAVGGGILLLIVVAVFIAYRFKSRENDNLMKKMQGQMDLLEAKVAKECKEAFTELQTDMTELTSDTYGQIVIPFWDYRSYCMRVLFPGEDDHPVIRDLEVDYKKREYVEKGLKNFATLLNNKTFLLTFVRTLEDNKSFTLRDRVKVASLISVALQTKMEYATDILKTLLAELIEKSMESKNQPKLLFRRNESVAEKMLTNWFTFLLYKFLRECAGEPLFMLFQATKQQVSKGPVDAVSGEARYSLSEDKLLRQRVDCSLLTVHVQELDNFSQQPIPVKVLDCDSISQVKEKILDAIFKNAPFSSRPGKDDVDLVLFDNTPEWQTIDSQKGKLILQDEDSSTKSDGMYKRLNTLSHYQVPDGAYMALVAKQSSMMSLTMQSDKSGSNKFDSISWYTRSPSLNRTVTPHDVHINVDGSVNKFFHLVRPHEDNTPKQRDRDSKMVSEIYLTRLLATKGTLQQYADDLFERIFSTAHRGTALPLAIKYMFDFLDDQALEHNIQDPEVVHTWKSNSLPLRFWVNVMKNPDFVFDVYKSNIVDSCLSVVAQTFMDSCSLSQRNLGINSPTSKLLYAKDIPKYKGWVERYYRDIKMMPAISDQDMSTVMAEESRMHNDEFNTNAALLELYKYVQKYYSEVTDALEEDEFARKNKLNLKLDQVQCAMDGKDSYC